MPRTQYTKEEIAQIAEEIYRRDIRPKVMPQHKGKFLILDIESGDYEMDEDDLSAEEILRARRPDGVFFGMRIGYTTAYTSLERWKRMRHDQRHGQRKPRSHRQTTSIRS